MAYKFVRRYCLIQDGMEITEKTPWFEWVGERNLFIGVYNKDNLNWRVVLRNGQYGVVDMKTGEIVLACRYELIAMTTFSDYGPCLILDSIDSNGEKITEIFCAATRKIISKTL